MTVRSVVMVVMFALARLAIGQNILHTEFGVNSRGLGLTGMGTDFGIGQLAPERPGLPGSDLPQNVHQWVTPFAVSNPPNVWVFHPHPQKVAGIMIAKDPSGTLSGIAPDAKLIAIAFGPNSDDETDVLVTLQHMISEPSVKVRAINSSWYLQGEDTDANNIITLAFDWSARVHDVLHVASGARILAGWYSCFRSAI